MGTAYFSPVNFPLRNLLMTTKKHKDFCYNYFDTGIPVNMITYEVCLMFSSDVYRAWQITCFFPFPPFVVFPFFILTFLTLVLFVSYHPLFKKRMCDLNYDLLVLLFILFVNQWSFGLQIHWQIFLISIKLT